MANNTNQQQQKPKGLTLVGKITLFLGIPTAAGCLGLLFAYFYPQGSTTSSSNDNPINFDRDFMFPFTLTLATVIAIGFQTNGFTGEKKPLIKWPQVKKTRKIIRKKAGSDDTDGSKSKED